MNTHSATKRNKLFTAAMAASATAIAAIGMLTSAAPAQAGNPCTDYAFNGPFNLRQDTGHRVLTNLTGQHANGEATVTPAIPNGNKGTVTGNISGRNVVLEISWGGGLTGTYWGTVDDNGFVHGTTQDNHANPAKTGWYSETSLACATQAPAQPKENTRIGKGPTYWATVIDEDVDIYNVPNEPNGRGHKIGILRVGDQVKLGNSSCKPESWCEVYGDNVPAPYGFVWGHLQLPY